MKLRYRNYSGFAAMLLAAGLAPGHAEDPAPQRGTPIIFSEPKSDTVSSNLNQLDLKASPFKRLESDLKKSFEIFDSGPFVGSIHPPSGIIAPAAPVNNRRIKENIDKRAEMILPGPESGDTDLAGDDPFKAAEDALGHSGRKFKTPLERYYDRLDRERTAFTNLVRDPKPLGNDKNPDGKEPASRLFPENPFDGDLKASARSLGRQSNNAVDRDGIFSENLQALQPKAIDERFDLKPSNPLEHASVARETRLEEFKRLLGGLAYVPGSNNYSPSLPEVGAAPRPAAPFPGPSWSSSSVPATPRDTFTSRAGLVGAPPQLPSLPSFSVTTPGLNPTPSTAPPPKPPVSSFSIPKRQF